MEPNSNAWNSLRIWVSELGAGRWKITIEPVASPVASNENIAPVIRDHSAFLNSYVAEDEGLYDHITG